MDFEGLLSRFCSSDWGRTLAYCSSFRKKIHWFFFTVGGGVRQNRNTFTLFFFFFFEGFPKRPVCCQIETEEYKISPPGPISEFESFRSPWPVEGLCTTVYYRCTNDVHLSSSEPVYNCKGRFMGKPIQPST